MSTQGGGIVSCEVDPNRPLAPTNSSVTSACSRWQRPLAPSTRLIRSDDRRGAMTLVRCLQLLPLNPSRIVMSFLIFKQALDHTRCRGS
jgi:hypothetical protein